MKRLRVAAAALAVSLPITLLAAPPVHAEPVPYEEMVHAAPSGDTRQSTGYVTFYVDLFHPGSSSTANIGVILHTYDCHGRLTGTSERLNPNWTFDDFADADRVWSEISTYLWKDLGGHPVGPLRWTVGVTQPGYDPYELSGVYNPNLPCPPVMDGDADVVIEQWSQKKPGFSSAKVGKKLAITDTRTTAPRKSYDWYVGGRRYHVGRSIRVKEGMVGKPIKVKVTIWNENETKSQSKTLRFGRAHS